MPTADVRSLLVRPLRSADLSFNTSGVLAFRHPTNAFLASEISTVADMPALYAALSTPLANGRLQYDSPAIQSYLASFTLFALRNEIVRTSLEEAITNRQSAFLERFSNKAGIIAEYLKVFPSKVTMLDQIRVLSQQRHDDLQAAYKNLNRTGVSTANTSTTDGATNSTNTSEDTSTAKGKTTTKEASETTASSTSKSNSSSSSTFDSTATTETRVSATATKTRAVVADADGRGERYLMEIQQKTNDATAEPPELHTFHKYYSDNLYNIPQVYQNGAWADHTSATPDFLADRTTTGTTSTGTDRAAGTADTTSSSTTSGGGESNSESAATSTGRSQSAQAFHQTTTVPNDELQYPYLDNDLRSLRTQITIKDEILSNALFGLKVPNLGPLLDNESAVLDLKVRQLQVALAHTFLVSPIPGFVTAVYKDVGESVRPGEAVVRVENFDRVLVLAVIRYWSWPKLGGAITLTTTNAFESGTPISLNGTLVSIRGHDAETDLWDVIFECDNIDTVGGQKVFKLPMNYTADHKDNVSVDFH